MTTGSWLTVVGMAGVILALAWQQRSIDRLRAELEQNATISPTPTQAPAPLRSRTEPSVAPPAVPAFRDQDRGREPSVALLEPDMDLVYRVTALEQTVATLGDGADHLMDRGAIPPTEAKTAEWRAALLNATRSADDRTHALRMLARNGELDDAGAYAAADLLRTSTDTRGQRHLLELVRGVENPALKQATVDLAMTSDSSRVRERAVSNLRAFADDPQVESALWQMMTDDESLGVRRQVAETLGRIPLTDNRVATLRAKALDYSAPPETRVASMHILQSGDQDISDIASPLARAAEQATDVESQRQYIQAFDNVNHPEFIIPLVNAVQSDDPDIRARAADALVDYRADPVVMEWLEYLAANDPDPDVREQGARVYRNGAGPSR